jgi:hypothetical protein
VRKIISYHGSRTFDSIPLSPQRTTIFDQTKSCTLDTLNPRKFRLCRSTPEMNMSRLTEQRCATCRPNRKLEARLTWLCEIENGTTVRPRGSKSLMRFTRNILEHPNIPCITEHRFLLPLKLPVALLTLWCVEFFIFHCTGALSALCYHLLFEKPRQD